MEEWEAGVVRWEWDPDLREVRGYGPGNLLLGTRDYTTEENEAADAYITFQEHQAQRAALEADAVVAVTDIGLLLTDLALLQATSDSTINAAPAAYVKQVAEGLVTVAEVQLKLLAYVFEQFDE